MKTVAVIPTYNAGRTISKIVQETKKYVDRVIVVDDCSSDDTAKIVQRLDVEYLLHSKNRGQGAATRTGMKIAIGLGANIIVTLDSDGQHEPSEIPQILKPILEDKADMVIGARFINKTRVPCYRKFGIDLINWLYNVHNGKKLTDTQSCFRAYTKQLIEKFIIEEDSFGFSTEVLTKIKKMKARMVEVPVSCIYHNLEQDSTMNPIKHGLEVAWKTIWWRLKLRS